MLDFIQRWQSDMGECDPSKIIQELIFLPNGTYPGFEFSLEPGKHLLRATHGCSIQGVKPSGAMAVWLPPTDKMEGVTEQAKMEGVDRGGEDFPDKKRWKIGDECKAWSSSDEAWRLGTVVEPPRKAREADGRVDDGKVIIYGDTSGGRVVWVRYHDDEKRIPRAIIWQHVKPPWYTPVQD